MGKAFFGWPMNGDGATLSGGSWVSSLPLSNLQVPLLSETARTTSASPADSIINADLGSSLTVGVVALCAHNLRSAATWRVRGSDASDMSSPVYDSGWVEVWGPQWPVGLLPVGHPNYATRRLTDAQIDALDPARDAVLLPAGQPAARYWRVEIDDNGNADNYVQVGRLVLASKYQPSYNFSYGAEFGFVDDTTFGKAMDGTRFYDSRRKGRTLGGVFTNLPDAEAYAVLRDMLEVLGQEDHVYFVTSDTDTESLQRRSFLATFRQLSAVQYAASGYSTVPFTVDEVL